MPDSDRTFDSISVLVIGNPHSNESTRAFLHKFIKVLCAISSKCFVISGDAPPNYENVLWLKPWYKKCRWKILNAFLHYLSYIDVLAKIMKVKGAKVAIILPSPMFLHVIFLRFFLRIKTAVFIAQKPQFLDSFFSRLSILFSNLIIVESRHVIKAWKIEKYSSKIAIGSLYVDVNFFDKFREVDQRDLAIGYLGSLDRRKGVDKLIEVFLRVNRRKRNLKLLIAGFGEYKGLLERLSGKNNIVYLGVLDRASLRNFYNSIRIFVLLSSSEGVPNVVLEAMACGTPVLATAVGGIPDIIRDNVTGFLINPTCELEEIENKLLSIIEDVHRCIEVSKKARLKIIEEFTYEKSVERYRKILRRLCYG